MTVRPEETHAVWAGVLAPGTQILVGGTPMPVPEEIAALFRPGDLLLAAGEELVHVPKAQRELAAIAVSRASAAFAQLGTIPDAAVTAFYRHFAARLADATIWERIAAANAHDVAQARARGRSTTRLQVSEGMRTAMIEGLRLWEQAPSRRGHVLETIRHGSWEVDQVIDGLGVVGFVFEGRPNVFADATGMLRGGNTAVLRIGGDALATARTITAEALQPALQEAGLPVDAVVLLESAERAAAWALFSDGRLALAVARGSGPAVAQLGTIARSAGIPASLHGTGGAWLIADETADESRFHAALFHSLDRKVCNTVNVVLVPRARADTLIPLALAALQARGEVLGHGFKVHSTETAQPFLPAGLLGARAAILRAGGAVEEPLVDILPRDALGREWEWEATPEVSLDVVADLQEAVVLCNRYSPRFVASLISERPDRHEWFFRAVDAPFVGDGFTRWVDGQYALNRPELGLSNWQHGRLFGRSGILSGDSVYAVRLRARQHDPHLRR